MGRFSQTGICHPCIPKTNSGLRRDSEQEIRVRSPETIGTWQTDERNRDDPGSSGCNNASSAAYR